MGDSTNKSMKSFLSILKIVLDVCLLVMMAGSVGLGIAVCFCDVPWDENMQRFLIAVLFFFVSYLYFDLLTRSK